MIIKIEEKDKDILMKIFELEKQIFEESHYSYEELEKMVGSNTYEILVYEDIKGYMILHDSFDVYEIMKIAIDKNFRKNGIGKKFINYYIENYKKNLMLEVREKNEIAKNFYTSLEFKNIGRRKNYYPNGETAILMMLEIDNRI